MLALSDIKKHLNIEDTFTDDDDYLSDLINVAYSAISTHLDCTVEEVENIPPLNHAVKLLVGNYYLNREPVTYSTINKVPYTFDYLLAPYKNYKVV